MDLLLQPDVAVSGPAALVLFSPLIDLTFGLARARQELRRDPAIRAVDAARLVALYSGGAAPAVAGGRQGHGAGRALYRYIEASQRL